MSLSYRPSVVSCEFLECRALFAVAYPTAQEQLVVEMINRGRADPAAEATRYGIALNEGVPSDKTIAATPKQPLAINPNLTAGARTHSGWMIDNDVFSHTGAGGTLPQQRMSASGYAFTGAWTSGENIAWRGTTGSVDVNATAAQLHADLFIDAGYPDRGHRTNQMKADYREIGVGVVAGAFAAGGTTYNAVMATENFAASGTNVFLTGVAYTDGVVDDNFYSIGEAVGGLTVTAVRAGDNATFSTTTWDSGGYSLALSAGTYTVTASGGGGALGGTIVHGGVVIGGQNVKRDFRPDMAAAPFATLANGHLEVIGTAVRDIVEITQVGGTLTVARGGAVQEFSAAAVTSIAVYLADGDDALAVGPGVIGLYCDGGMGNDQLAGGEFSDTLTGSGNHDKIFGGAGDDRINGSGGHDRLFGETGRDRLYAGAGFDVLDGGAHVDRLFPDAGRDTLFGQQGHDQMYAQDGEADLLYGASGSDTADVDEPLDVLSSVETWY